MASAESLPGMGPWTEMPLAAFDLETTSAQPYECRIVTACLVRIDGSTVTPRNWLLDPEIPIPEEAAKIHGISTAKARADGQDYLQGYAEIRLALEQAWLDGYAVVVFNAAFDITVMHSEGRRLGFEPLNYGTIVDPFVYDRHFRKMAKGPRKLVDQCAHYGVRIDNAHEAQADALAAARLAWKLPRRYPPLARLTPEQLMTMTAQWHEERQESFIRYRKREKLPYDDVSTTWPLQTQNGKAA